MIIDVNKQLIYHMQTLFDKNEKNITRLRNKVVLGRAHNRVDCRRNGGNRSSAKASLSVSHSSARHTSHYQ